MEQKIINLINKEIYTKSYNIAYIFGIYSCSKIQHPHRLFTLSVLQTSNVKRIKYADTTYFHKEESIKYMNKFINRFKLGKNVLNYNNHIWSFNLIK